MTATSLPNSTHSSETEIPTAEEIRRARMMPDGPSRDKLMYTSACPRRAGSPMTEVEEIEHRVRERVRSHLASIGRSLIPLAWTLGECAYNHDMETEGRNEPMEIPVDVVYALQENLNAITDALTDDDFPWFTSEIGQIICAQEKQNVASSSGKWEPLP